MNWVGELIVRLLEVFLGWVKHLAREDLRQEIKKETDDVQEKWAEIDSRPTTTDGALQRLRDRSAARRRPVP